MRFRATQTVGEQRTFEGTRADLLRAFVWINGSAWTARLASMEIGDYAGASGDFGRAYRIERIA